MTDKPFDRLFRVFSRVVSAPPDRREALLRDLTGDDEALVRDLRRLLAIDEAIEAVARGERESEAR